MTGKDYTEDRLVQKTVADYFEDKLGWDSVYAFGKKDPTASQYTRVRRHPFE